MLFRSVIGATDLSIPANAFMVNLPRHPSQLYEAALEGVVLWLLIWFVFRRRRPFPGALIGLYVTGYGLARFLAEYFRATSEEVGYVTGPALTAPPVHFTASVIHLTEGQLISAAMFGLGVVLYVVFRVIAPRNEVIETFDAE